MTSHTRAIVLVLVAARLQAQCPDGSPPPCGAQRAPAATRSTRRLPDSIRVLYDRAVGESRRRTADGAAESMDLLARVIAFDSSYAPAWATLSQISQMGWLRRWERSGIDRDSLLALAIRASRRAIQLDSGLASAWVAYARAAGSVDVADRSATRHALERALSIDPKNMAALFELGMMEEELLHPAAAERAWKRALAISPTHLESLAFLALHYFLLHDYGRARRFADSALAIDPTYTVARQTAGEIALAQRRWAEAERQVTTGMRAGEVSEPAMSMSILARAALGRGDVEAAKREIQRAERAASLERPTRHESAALGAAWAELGDTARALQWLRAYTPKSDLHYQLHLKRDPGLRWLATRHSELLVPSP